MTPDICFFVFAHVRNVRQNFGTRTAIYGNCRIFRAFLNIAAANVDVKEDVYAKKLRYGVLNFVRAWGKCTLSRKKTPGMKLIGLNC